MAAALFLNTNRRDMDLLVCRHLSASCSVRSKSYWWLLGRN